MRKSIRIGTAAGIPLLLHWTFLLIPVYVLLSGIATARASMGILGDLIFIAAVFACVVLHELGHALAARRFGIQTRDIILMPIGGVARMERIPRRPMEEILVALAGPAVNVIIAAVLLLATLPLRAVVGLTTPSVVGASLIDKVILVNVAMIVFNMLPAFPLDGGRVLRALFSSRLGHLKGTRIAASVGQLMAVLLGLGGLFVFNNPMLIFIAGFIFLGAAQEAAVAETEVVMTDLDVRDVMFTRFDAIPAQTSAVWALRFAMAANKNELPVVSGGRFEGLVKLQDLADAVSNGQPEISVGCLCNRRVSRVAPGESITVVFEKLQRSAFASLPVVDALGHLNGIVTRESILAAQRFGAVLRRLPSTPLSYRPDELRQHLTRMQIG